MKKLVLMAAIALMGFTVTAQGGFRVGLNAGLPVGDAADWTSFYGNADVDYDWSISEKLNLGVTTGFSTYSGKNNFGSFEYIPAGGSVDYNINDKFAVGGDVGVTFSLESGGGTDFLYRFKFSYQATEDVDVTARFNSISGDGSTWSNFSIGVGYRFN